MINLFINYDDFIADFNYIYSIFYYLNIKIKIINNDEEIKIFFKENYNSEINYIFYNIFNTKLFIELKLLYNINIFYFINQKIDNNILNKNYQNIKYILISSNYYHLLHYDYEKLLLLNQFDINDENKIDEIQDIYVSYQFKRKFVLLINDIKYKLLNDNNVKNSIVIFDIITVKDEFMINELILNGNYILVKNNEDLDFLFFNNLIFKYDDAELQILDLINEINENFENYQINYNNYIKYYKNKLLIENKKFYQNIEKFNDFDNKFGFLILRYVNSLKTNNLWYNNIKNIRKYYRNKIYIIDDNSNYEYVDTNNNYIDIGLIQSNYHQRGEILPYYYLYIKQLFNRCLIIHDSVFINKYIDFTKYNDEIYYLWHFEHNFNNLIDENKMMKILNNEKIIEKYDEKKWYGCFGVQTLISYSFVEKLQNNFKIFDLLKYIDNRSKRMNFERVFSVLCTLLDNNIFENESLYGNIHNYMEWGYNYDKYITDENKDILKKYDLIKIWNGR